MMLKGMLRHVGGVTVHKFWVARNLALFILDDVLEACSPIGPDFRPSLYADLAVRAARHDLSKYLPDEAIAFARTSDRLKVTEYGTDDYRRLLAMIRPAIERHYARNSHHPEHHHEGVRGMSEADVIEMIADWGAAVRRSANGDLERSIVENADRFEYDRDAEIKLRGIAARMRLV
jgi:uncharacterized protein DUF5662